MRAPDVITNVTKQNMNVMEKKKKKHFRQIKIICYQYAPYILSKKMHTDTW